MHTHAQGIKHHTLFVSYSAMEDETSSSGSNSGKSSVSSPDSFSDTGSDPTDCSDGEDMESEYSSCSQLSKACSSTSDQTSHASSTTENSDSEVSGEVTPASPASFETSGSSSSSETAEPSHGSTDQSLLLEICCSPSSSRGPRTVTIRKPCLNAFPRCAISVSRCCKFFAEFIDVVLTCLGSLASHMDGYQIVHVNITSIDSVLSFSHATPSTSSKTRVHRHTYLKNMFYDQVKIRNVWSCAFWTRGCLLNTVGLFE